MLEREVVPSSSKGVRPVPSNTSTRSRPSSRGTLVGHGTVDTSKALRPVPSSTSSLKPSARPISSTYLALVDKAVKEHKVFCLGGVYPAVRAALRKRGWIEKSVSTSAPQYMRSIIGAHLVKDVDTKPSSEDDTEGMYTQRVLANYAPDFIWVIRRDNIPWAQIQRDQTINRFPRAYFTTKVGIAACLQSIHWFSEPGISDTFFPRCYRLSMEEEKQAFLDDYRLTACVGLLRWFCSTYEKFSERGVYDPASKVSCLALDFAVRQLNNYVRMRQHEDIDWLLPPAYLSQHWEIFLTQYYSVVHQRSKLNPSDATEPIKVKYDFIKKTLQYLGQVWSTMNADGIMNIWICKPGARSRGKGIVLMNQLDKILALLSQSQAREANWVVQKYIERPLLIYKTKFDMRQWFIVTDWAPLTVWFAKESYVRFCTKPFSLDDFHESIHLCNNAVQCKYTNAQNRDPSLPEENMWDCYTFQAYLKTIGKLELWDKVIYPGMKQGILGVLLASQDSAEVKKNCFELYGADYMFTEDFKPWLIEINSCPCMAGSTSVTARMCAQCLEDTIKVVIDKKNDRNADTGMFEMIYRQNPLTLNFSSFNSNELMISGKKMSKDVDWPGLLTKHAARQNMMAPRKSMMAPVPTSKVSLPLPDAGLTFTDLVQKLHLKETSKILGLSPYETVQQALQQATPTSPQTAKLTPSKLPVQPASTEKSASLEPKGILTVRKLPPPVSQQPPKETAPGATAQLSEMIRNAINNNNTTLPVQNGILDLEKSSIPLSYLLYNAKSNPITITDMIREYTESTNKSKAMEILARKVIEAERKPKRKVIGRGNRSKSPSRTKTTIAANSTKELVITPTGAEKRPTSPARSRMNDPTKKFSVSKSKSPSETRTQYLTTKQSLREAVDVSRTLKLNNLLQPLSPTKK